MNEIMGDGLDTGNVREQASEANEEELGNVREQLAKAAQIRKQLAQAQIQQGNYAQMLTLLLNYVQDATLLKGIFHQITEMQTPIEFVFAQFYPGLTNWEDLSRFVQAYPHLEYKELMQRQITPFVQYVRELRKLSLLGQIPLEQYIDFLLHVLLRTGIVDMHERDDPKKQQFIASLHAHLQG